MAQNVRPALAQLQLHLSPPPRNINESRAVLRTLEQFGQIVMFKVLRFEETTKELTPKAHIIFKSATSAKNLLAASQVYVPSTGITIVPSESIFKHQQYIEYASAAHYIKDQSLLFQRWKGPKDKFDVEIEDTSIRFGSEDNTAPTTLLKDMRTRLLERYSGEFIGITYIERKIAFEENLRQLRREQNEKLAKGEAVDLSRESEEVLRQDQLNTIQDILGDLGEDFNNLGDYFDEGTEKKNPAK